MREEQIFETADPELVRKLHTIRAARSVFDVTRVRGGVVDCSVGVYEHQLLPAGSGNTPWLIGRRRVLIDHSIESAGGQVSILL